MKFKVGDLIKDDSVVNQGQVFLVLESFPPEIHPEYTLLEIKSGNFLYFCFSNYWTQNCILVKDIDR